MMDDTRTEVYLDAEDRARAHRLNEEIQGRLEELAALACRAAGARLSPDMPRRYVPRAESGLAADETRGSYRHIEIVETPTDPPITFVVTYYDDGSVSVSPVFVIIDDE
jgi:hypothetical protein